MADLQERIKAFHDLHASGCFVIPNPWDVGTARVLEQLGFPALATTSSGFAWSIGRSDNHSSLEQALAHARQMAEGVSVPISADFQDCFAVEPAGVAANVRAVIGTGVAGFSIEDSTRAGQSPLFDLALAVERVSAAVEAARASPAPPVITARTEGFLVGLPSIEQTIRRLVAFAEAGADCLYAPGIMKAEDITEVVQAVSPKPVNVLVGSGFTSVSELAALGVRRISVGGALARVAWGAFLEAAREIATAGEFSGLGKGVPFRDLDDRFRPHGGA